MIVLNRELKRYNYINLKIFEEGIVLKKWYDEEFEWEIEVIGFNKSYVCS